MDEKLPDGWVETTLGDSCVVIMGQSPPSSEYNKDGEGLPFFQGKAEFTDLYPQVKKWCTSPMKIAEADDILLSVRAPVGPTNIALSRCCIGRGLAAIRPEGSIDFRYVLYAIRNFNASLTQIATGTTFEAISGDDIAAFRLPLAPLPEQHRIVAAIEQQFTRLDNAIASLQSARARIKQYRASLLKAAVEGGLTKEWRAAHPAEETGAQLLARILTERRARWEEEQLAKMREKGITPKDDKWKQKYEEPQGPDVEELPDLPKGWCWATVEQIAQIQGGIQKQPSRAPHQNAYPYLRVANVLRGRLDLSVIEKMELFGNELEILRLKRGDLLIVEGNGSKTEIGRSALWNEEIKDCVHQNHIIRVRLNHVIPKYIDFYWNSPEGNRRVMDVAASTTGLYTLSVNKISRLPAPLPPLLEQAQIVAEVEARLSNIAQMEETIEASLKRAEHERQSILREAFAGRLVPQNLEDEPASVLLMRIREERRKREEAEKIARSSRKGIQMEIARKRRTGKASLYTTLVDAARPLPPDDLFKRAGLKTDEQPESVEEFYEELDADVESALVAETRPVYGSVLLEALEPSNEEKARMEAEAARQAQEVVQGEETMDNPTLWNG